VSVPHAGTLMRMLYATLNHAREITVEKLFPALGRSAALDRAKAVLNNCAVPN
jgi:hypothetical protein